ncbi:hypothetical protein [Tessaracoccus lacteus]|uniref:Uncharacterized protein n=1 Tax=Tessaracoccus lacteus TaxID=3041766 RepID=A0ABY8PXC1_9ACTN|nr:hypothetical protein [Tessaracoccus sp. T21]WGT47119.1 hypothetical protein QH948_13545 [Tessaracoccus sp. T21]
MIATRKMIMGGLAAALALGAVLPAAASTGEDPNPPTKSDTQGEEFGKVLRARFYENGDLSGKTLRSYGSGPCTGSTDRPDVSWSSLPSAWNDSASSARDYASCDIKLYWDTDFGGATYGYHNFGESGAYFGATWNDEMSSYRLS